MVEMAVHQDQGSAFHLLMAYDLAKHIYRLIPSAQSHHEMVKVWRVVEKEIPPADISEQFTSRNGPWMPRRTGASFCTTR